MRIEKSKSEGIVKMGYSKDEVSDYLYHGGETVAASMKSVFPSE